MTTTTIASPPPTMTPAARDRAVNGLVLGFAGAMWLSWAQQGPPAGWSLPLAIDSGIGLLVAVFGGVLVWRRRHGASTMAVPRGRRTYYRVVGVWTGPVTVLLVNAVAGGGGFLVMAGYLLWRGRR